MSSYLTDEELSDLEDEKPSKNSAISNNEGILKSFIDGSADAADSLTHGVLAGLAGAVKGAGQTYEKVGEFADRLEGVPYKKGQSIFDYSHPNNPVTKFLFGLEKNNPNATAIGNFAGEVVAPIGIPGAGIAGKLSEKAIGNSLGSGIISKAAKTAANSATQGAIVNPLVSGNENTGQSSEQGALLSAILSLAGKTAYGAGKLGAKALKRAKDIFSVNLDDLKNTAQGLYNEAIQVPQKMGIKITPTKFGNLLMSNINKFISGNPNVKNNEYLETLFKHLDGVTENNVLSDTPENVHEVIKNLNDQAQSAMPGKPNIFRLPQNRAASKMFGDLAEAYKQDLKDSLIKAGMKDSAAKFDQANEFYKNTYLPVRDTHLNNQDVRKQQALGLASQVLNPSIAGAIGKVISPLSLKANRFFSTFESPNPSIRNQNGYQNMLQESRITPYENEKINRLSAALSSLMGENQ